MTPGSVQDFNKDTIQELPSSPSPQLSPTTTTTTTRSDPPKLLHPSYTTSIHLTLTPPSRTRHVSHSPHHPPSLTLSLSIHTPGRHLKRDLTHVFTHYTHSTPFSHILVVPTFWKSVTDLIAVTPDSNWERNWLLEAFCKWVEIVRARLSELGYWADATDPASGYPMYTPRGTSLYPDVDGAHRLLRYPTLQAGCCRVISHDQWGTRSYPATFFTTAPADVLVKVLAQVEKELEAPE
ncbi:hypothetical protein BC829DRAFT_442314 [Chytridium lagenaria]|nr:hypothetical protein BC829DRAFT_442314 [Chytridium lagenaria]